MDIVTLAEVAGNLNVVATASPQSALASVWAS